MTRNQTEKRILYIVGIMKNEALTEALTRALPLFSMSELGEILKFLESGKEETIYNLLKSKVEEYRNIAEKVKLLQTKIQIETMEKKDEDEKKPALELLNFV